MSTVDSCLSKETVTKPGIFFGRGLGDSPPLFSSLPSNMKKAENLEEHFFICYLAAPQSTLGYYQEVSPS